MLRRSAPQPALVALLLVVGCAQQPLVVTSTATPTAIPVVTPSATPATTAERPPDDPVDGCEGQAYAEPADSLYVLPFAVGDSVRTGLTNCSSSFHGTGQPDQYAFDFDMPVGMPFMAARGGTVAGVVEGAPSEGGGAGNRVVIDHHDGTFGLYYHSPMNGIDVAVGDQVEQGDVLGTTGRSGLAGYPHLHFIVVTGSPTYPYEGVAVSFRNAMPPDAVLRSYAEYTAVPYE